jgi:hypothetical protein
MEKYNLILLVMASRGDIYDQLIQDYWIPFIRHLDRTYGSPVVHVFFLFGANSGGSPSNLLAKNVLVFDDVVENLIPGVCRKTLLALEHIQSHYTYKHILRTNLSSFFIDSLLIRKSASLPETGLYDGIQGMHGNIPFVSGAGIWLSRDMVDVLLSKRNPLDDSNLPDDVAIAQVLHPCSSSSSSSNFTRYDICYDCVFDETKVDKVLDLECYHIRIKNKNRQLDMEYMKAFAQKLSYY